LPLDSQQTSELDASRVDGRARGSTPSSPPVRTPWPSVDAAVGDAARFTLLQQLRAGSQSVLEWALDLAWPAVVALRAVLKRVYAFLLPWAKAQPLWKFCTGSLSRRIFTANLAGLIILLSGFSTRG
jgi:hypothetical protein